MYKSFKIYSGKGAADTAHPVSTELGRKLLVHEVMVAYSAAPTHAGVTATFDSGLGADYDVVLDTSAANARYYTYKPTSPFILMEDDKLTVNAPAGGGVITAAITIIASEL